MTTDRPPPHSLWATRCPDAYPFEWYQVLGLQAFPDGFTRFATDAEAALILGRSAPPEFEPTGKQVTPTRKSGARGSSSRSAVRQRFLDLSTFLRGPHRELTPTERVVWLCVYALTQAGRAVVTQARMAEYGGVTVRAVKKAVRGLVGRGLLEVVQRGGPGRASVYRYRSG